MKRTIIIATAIYLSLVVIVAGQVGYSSNIGTSTGGGGSGAGVGNCAAGQVVTGLNAGSGPTCSDNITPGTLTADNPFEFSQTWNNAAITFHGLNVNITGTASDTGSALFSANQIGEGQAFAILQDSATGVLGSVGIAVNQGTNGTANSLRYFIKALSGKIAFQAAVNNPGTRVLIASGFSATENSGSDATTKLAGVGLTVSSNGSYTFTDTADNAEATKDTGVTRAAAGSVAVGNGTLGDFTGSVVATLLQTKTVVAVASLPTCNGAAEGTHASVNNALTPVALANVSGGGSVHISVYCNGTNWIVQ